MTKFQQKPRFAPARRQSDVVRQAGAPGTGTRLVLWLGRLVVLGEMMMMNAACFDCVCGESNGDSPKHPDLSPFFAISPFGSHALGPSHTHARAEEEARYRLSLGRSEAHDRPCARRRASMAGAGLLPRPFRASSWVPPGGSWTD